MALALYRKYRPRTFAEVIGQEHVTEPLSQALRSGRLNHAYLFSGPRGCGKTSSARILARSLNCERGPTPEPCGECQSCRDLAPDGAGSIDVIEIDAASHGGVDDARDLRERAFFAPVSSRFKVYVIDEAHMVSSAGFNALLKLVEEPPEYVKFVFATTEPEKVLGTIKSRTHHYPFRLIPPGVLRPYLEQLTAAEGVKVEPAVFPLVVRAGAGSARDSLSVLDQLIAGAGEEGVTYSRAVALLGVTDVALIDEMCDALAANDGRGAYGVIDRVVEAGHDPRRFASDLLERLRDLIVLQQVPDAVTKGLLDAPHDELERMGAQAAQLGQATLSRFADIVHNGLTEMRGTTAPRLLLELITARMLLPGADDSSAALLQRLERMERRLQAGGVPAPLADAGTQAGPDPAAAPVRGSVEGGNRGLDYIREPRGGPAAAPGGLSGGASGGQRPAPEVPDASWSASSSPASAPASSVSASAPSGAPGSVAAAPAADAPPPSSASDGPAAQPASGGSPAGSVAGPAAAGGGGFDAEAMRRAWPDVLAVVNDKSKKSGAILRDAIVQDVEGTMLVLGFKYSTHANMLNAAPEVLISALQELFGGRWQVRCEVGGQPGGGGGGARPTPPKPGPQPSGPSAPAPPTHRTVPGQASGPAPSAAAPPAPAPPSVSPGPSAAAVASAVAVPSAVADRPLAASAGRPAGGGSPVVASSGAADEDWPTTAVPGGGAAPAGVQHAPVEQPSAALTPQAAGQRPASDVGRGPATTDSAAFGSAPSGAPGASGAGAGRQEAPSGVGAVGTAESAAAGWSGAAPGVGGAGSAAAGLAAAPGAVNGARGGTGSPGGMNSGTALHGSVPPGPANGGRAGTSAPSRPGRPRQGASSALERAREAASRAAASANAGRRGAGSAPAAAPAPAAESAWEGTGADEPPFDPEYDSPVPESRFPGLDPGDELLDDATEVRETSEEAALRLLVEALGAEKIGETTG